MRDFFFLIKSFDVGRPTFNLNLLRWEDIPSIQIFRNREIQLESEPHLLLAAYIKDLEEGSLLTLACFLFLLLASPFLH